MNLITGRTGTDHVLARHDAMIHRTLLGNGDFVLQYANNITCTPNDATHVNINTGMFVMQGRLCEIAETETVEVTPCSSENLRKKAYVCAEYTIDNHGIEDVHLIVIEGPTASNIEIEPTIPYKNGNIDIGEIHQMPLYALFIEGFSINNERTTREFTLLETEPIQTALDYARSNVTNITNMLNSLSSGVYSYVDDLMEGVSQGIKGQWKKAVDISEDDAYSPIEVNMGSSYTFTSSDIIDVYLNGFKLLSDKYSVTGYNQILTITLEDCSFYGRMEVVVIKIAEEV